MKQHLLLALGALLASGAAHAVIDCELDGKPINTNNGAETAGKTGLLRCKDRDSGVLQREQELRDGKYVGALRYYKQGVLEQERNVNERGNAEGVQREYAATPGPNNPLLLEETRRNGQTVGLSRAWHRNGQLRRATFYVGDNQEEAVAEFTQQGQLADLRCASQPRLAPAADDAAWCGHRGGPAVVQLYAENGSLRGRLTHDKGRRTQRESLWENGKTQELEQVSADGGQLRNFNKDGVKRREQQWLAVAAEGRSRRVTVLDREYHDSGALQRERRWVPAEVVGGRLVSDVQWYLNGQPRQRTSYENAEGGTLRRDQGFYDNGKLRVESQWLMTGRYDERAMGVHKVYDEQGRLRLERHFDAKGRASREREFDEAGKPTRDDELFEDGSRKANAR